MARLTSKDKPPNPIPRSGEDLMKYIDRNLSDTKEFLKLMEIGDLDKASKLSSSSVH